MGYALQDYILASMAGMLRVEGFRSENKILKFRNSKWLVLDRKSFHREEKP